jgi:hypothetical protein
MLVSPAILLCSFYFSEINHLPVATLLPPLPTLSTCSTSETSLDSLVRWLNLIFASADHFLIQVSE